MRIGPLEIALILIVVGMLIGTKQLPAFGRKAGEAVKDFKVNSKDMTDAVKVVKSEIDDVKNAITMDLTGGDKNG